MTPPSPALHRNPWLTQTVRITEATDEAEGVRTYRLKLDGDLGPDSYEFVAGQFNMLYLPGVGESAISMSGNPASGDGWLHTVRIAGNVTKTLAGLHEGDTLGLRGPFGTGWPVDQIMGRDLIIVAGGLGLAPLRPMIYEVMNRRERFGNVWLICGARTPDGLLYQREFDSWSRGGINVQLTVDRASPGWTGHVGVVTLLIDRLRLPRPDQTSLVACGPEVMMKYAAASGMRIGVPAEQLWVSLERNMQCAAGLCGHCQLGPEFICKDGPVMRYDRVRPYLFVEQL